jgi:CheY-like chemotaxis protein
MARITCFIDTPTLAQQIEQLFEQSSHTIQMVPASQLNHGLRLQVQRFAPDLVLMELAHSIDNPHIFFFLRSDQATRDAPIMVFSSSVRLAEEASILGADAHLPRNFGINQLRAQVKSLLANRLAAAAA